MLRITASSTVEDARQAMRQLAQDAVVVWEECTPIGVVTDADLSGQARSVSPKALVGDVMSHECVSIDAAADLPQTHHAYTDAAWTSLKRRRPFSPETLERRAAIVPALAAPKEEPCHS